MITHKLRTILGDIPEEWETITLRDALLEHVSGDWGSDHGEVECSVLRSTNFTEDGRISFDDVATRFLTANSAKKLNLKANDLLLERSGGGPTQPVGRVAFVETDLPGFAFSNFVQRLRINSEKMDPGFVGWLLYELNRSRVVERLQHQTTQMRNLEYRDYLRITLPKPDNNEQKAIAEAIRESDRAVVRAKEELLGAKRLKTSLMQQLFAKGVPGRHKRFKSSKIGEIPEEWDVIKLKKCGKWGTGGTPDRSNKAFWNGTIPWVKSGEVDYSTIRDSDEKISDAGAVSINGELLPCGTLLVAMYGAGVTRGKAALLGLPAYINQAIAYFEGNTQTDNRWMLYWFERNYGRVRTLAGGSNQDNLSLYLLKNIEIARPNVDEQWEVVELLKRASDHIDAIYTKMNLLQQLKYSLLQNLLTGRVRVNLEAKV